jgi:hypothetical protein
MLKAVNSRNSSDVKEDVMRPDTTINASDKSRQEPTEKSLHDLQESGSDFGNFFPKHHVLLAFEQEQQARDTQRALEEAGFKELKAIDDREMEAASQKGLDSASPIAATGASLKMVELHNKLAKEGCHFLLVKAEGDEQTEALMNTVRQRPFRLAQKYHRLVIEVLH